MGSLNFIINVVRCPLIFKSQEITETLHIDVQMLSASVRLVNLQSLSLALFVKAGGAELSIQASINRIEEISSSYPFLNYWVKTPNTCQPLWEDTSLPRS